MYQVFAIGQLARHGFNLVTAKAGGPAGVAHDGLSKAFFKAVGELHQGPLYKSIVFSAWFDSLDGFW
jgi:hypothetical protein